MNLSSYKIFSIFGIDVELHWSFLLFILALFLLDPSFLLVILVIFTFVTLHEISHSLVSRHHDISVKKILLLPIGGMAMMDTTDLEPWAEIKMALAGPMLNFVAAGIFFLLSQALGLPLIEWFNQFWSNPETFSLPLGHILLFYSFYANLVLGTFNMLVPAFPLDGGRVFRAALAMKYPYLKATEVAKYLSYVFAGGLFLIGSISLFAGGGGLWIMIISVFIAIGASSEYKGLVIHSALSQVDLSDIMTRDYPELDPEETIKQGVQRVMSSKRSNGLITGEKPGIIDMNKLGEVPKKNWGEVSIEKVKKETKVFKMDSSAEDIFKYINSSGNNPIPIMENGEVKGAIYLSDMQRMVKFIKKLGVTRELPS